MITIIARDLMKLEKQCADFNARWPIGTNVVVIRDGGEGVVTEARSQAQVLSGHTAVIWLEGLRGCYELTRVVPIAPART